jgi:branched-chain amino acid transport system permease protein
VSYFSELAALCSIGAMLAMAAYLPLTSGSIVICVGSAMGAGAVAAGSVAGGANDPLSVALAIVAGAVAGGTVMLIVGALTQNLRGFLFSLATLAAAELLRILAENQAALGGALGYRVPPGGLLLVWPLVCCALTFAAVVTFDRTLWRKAVALGAESPVRAAAIGVDIFAARTLLMAAGGVIAGAAGALYIYQVGVLDPRWWGFEAGLQVAAFAIVGGSRHVAGALIAGIALTLAPELLRFSADQRMLVFGAVLIIAVVLRPEGRWRFASDHAGPRLPSEGRVRSL